MGGMPPSNLHGLSLTDTSATPRLPSHPSVAPPPPPHPDANELLDFSSMLGSPDLSQMDWSTDPGFNLDLDDVDDDTSLSLDTKMADMFSQPTPQGSESNSSSSGGGGCLSMDPGSVGNLSSVSHLTPGSVASSSGCGGPGGGSTGLRTPSNHGSESDLTALGLGGDSVDPATEMDMSDWLDVIMPNPATFASTGNPVTAPMPPAPSHHMGHHGHSADPILTPRTQQEVFDIFNFEDQDFGTSAMSWDKVVEQGLSS